MFNIKHLTIFKIITLSTSLISIASYSAKPDNLANTPPMGWNSWNHFACNIDEKLIMQTADDLVSTGLRDAGYIYVNMDDCWHGKRDENGFIQADSKRFPNGIKPLADYVHSKGLKLGIYSDAGEKTCAGYPGSQGYEYQDALQYARWGIDYLKYDWCNTGQGKAQRNPIEAYSTMSKALAAAGRPIVLSICEWGDNKPWEWAKDIGHLWRTTGDIINCWDCEVGHGSWVSKGILPILDQQNDLRAHAGPNSWNDPDMMEVGNLPTIQENRAHFAMWAMLAAPLIIGTDIRNLDDKILNILKNKNIIAVNQDSRGIQGFRFYQDNALEIWLKLLSNGDFALAFLNRGDKDISHSMNFESIEMEDSLLHWRPNFDKQSYKITDLWSGNVTGDTNEILNVSIEPRDALIFRFSIQK